MAIEFINPITAGTVLVRSDIRSQNFVTGVSGWRIEADGDAEFNNIVIRGGTQTGGAILMYDGTPAAGNLVISLAQQAGVDEFGNAYFRGFNVGDQTAAHFGVDIFGNVYIVNPANENVIQLRPNKQAIWMYDGDPATGNLQIVMASTAGVDEHSNNYPKGISILNGGTLTAEDTAGDTVVISPNTATSGLLASQPGMAMQPVTNTGDPAVVGALDPGGGSPLGTLITSPSAVAGGTPGTDFAQIYMTGAYSGGKPNITLSADGTGATIDMNGTELNSDGVITQYGFNAYNTYTPTVGGDGTATYSTRTGWYQRVGGMVFFTAYLVVNNPGSGAGNVTITAPTSIDRTTRQVVHAHTESLTAGNNGSGTALAFVSGSGSTFDRIRNSTNGSITGADLLANGIITVEGWYREA